MKKSLLLKLSMLAMFVTLASCGGGGSKATIGARTSPNILASEFVAALNSADGTSSTAVELYTNETLRSQVAGQDDWFVIWDAKFGEYKAVSLQYIRSIVYFDYYANNNAVAHEFRSIESADVLAGNLNGDLGGDDYEVVDRLSSGFYEGRESGFLYEDELESKDVSLLAREQEQKKFFEKSSFVSIKYNVSLPTAMSMITLGSKVEKMLARGNGELTEADQLALSGNIKSLTGVSIEEMEKALANSQTKDAVLAKIAEKVGTSAQNIEEKFLPEVFGITL